METIFTESRATRRIVGQLPQGSVLPADLLSLCASLDIKAAEIRITGVLEEVELSELDPDSGSYEAIDSIQGPVTLLQGYGNLTTLGNAPLLSATVLVSWKAEAKLQLAGGHLLSARVRHLELFMDSFDDLEIHRGMAADSGLITFQELLHSSASSSSVDGSSTPSPPAAPAEDTLRAPKTAVAAATAPESAPLPQASPLPASRPSRWADLVEISTRLDNDAGQETWVAGTEPDLKRRDILLHPRFGSCQVLRIEDDERAVLRDSKGKPRTLSLAHIQVKLEGTQESGAREFRVKIGSSRSRR